MTARKPRKRDQLLPTIGWREWVALPGLDIPWIKAKVDTGARSSSLHAYDIRHFERRGERWVRFKVHPAQKNHRILVEAEAPVVDQRTVKSSSGQQSLRWVVSTDVEVLGTRWPIELTLTRRDTMGFRMLLGRQAIRGHFLVDPGHSFLGGAPPKGTHPGRASTGPRAPADPAPDGDSHDPSLGAGEE